MNRSIEQARSTLASLDSNEVAELSREELIAIVGGSFATGGRLPGPTRVCTICGQCNVDCFILIGCEKY